MLHESPILMLDCSTNNYCDLSFRWFTVKLKSSSSRIQRTKAHWAVLKKLLNTSVMIRFFQPFSVVLMNCFTFLPMLSHTTHHVTLGCVHWAFVDFVEFNCTWALHISTAAHKDLVKALHTESPHLLGLPQTWGIPNIHHAGRQWSLVHCSLSTALHIKVISSGNVIESDHFSIVHDTFC